MKLRQENPTIILYSFEVVANNVSERNVFIQSATLNGKVYKKSFLKHSDIINGGSLIFEMGPSPNKAWGRDKEDAPVSSIGESNYIPVPYLKSGDQVFKKSSRIAIDSYMEMVDIYYTTDVNKSARYIRIRGKNIGVNPEWHLSAGGKAWIFIDEIIIE
jgi:hypothetical protein